MGVCLLADHRVVLVVAVVGIPGIKINDQRQLLMEHVRDPTPKVYSSLPQFAVWSELEL